MKLPTFHRRQEILRIRRKLEREGYPRIQMSLLVMITGGSGFITSFVLLHHGLVEMWQRYLISFGVAYLVFLFLLWLWLRTRPEDYTDFPDLSGAMPSDTGSTGGSSSAYSGHDGNFGGGGASSSYAVSPEHASIAGDSSGPVSEAIGAVAQTGEFAIPLAALMVILLIATTLLCSSLFMIYTAPALFAELVVDGVLSVSLYRKLRGLQTQHWLNSAIRRTVFPFMLTAAIVSASGWGLSRYAPEAHSIGDVIHHAKHYNHR